ncbi:SCO2322 family protein [Streptomyces sp. NPDC086077]|uniref:SCO2322 family protein n=1 Tax=Streptomyces sp. NPDC086077 TaxID=3154862 RepID=UPI003421B885
MTRRAALLFTALLIALAGGTGPAQATGYRYWSFWERDGEAWTYATQGPSTARPADGSVQGFRFAVSEDSQDASQPRGEAGFTTICAGTPARDGQKRVALVIDFGTASDAPSGETPPASRTACARLAPDGTTADALAAVAKPLRYDADALLCAIGGYPEKGCGEQVSSERKASPASEAGSGGGPSLGIVAGVAAVAVLGAAVGWQARRHRHG